MAVVVAEVGETDTESWRCPCSMKVTWMAGWILRGEKLFNIYREKLKAAVVSMEGNALRWFQFENRRRPIKGWRDLKSRVVLEFQAFGAGTVHEQWLAITRTTTVVEYRQKLSRSYRVSCTLGR